MFAFGSRRSTCARHATYTGLRATSCRSGCLQEPRGWVPLGTKEPQVRGKLADAELHFTDGPLEGLKLIGFSIWERRGGTGRNVTFPARQYSVNGERRSFALLRPVVDATAQDAVRERILEAYAEYEESAATVDA